MSGQYSQPRHKANATKYGKCACFYSGSCPWLPVYSFPSVRRQLVHKAGNLVRSVYNALQFTFGRSKSWGDSSLVKQHKKAMDGYVFARTFYCEKVMLNACYLRNTWLCNGWKLPPIRNQSRKLRTTCCDMEFNQYVIRFPTEITCTLYDIKTSLAQLCFFYMSNHSADVLYIYTDYLIGTNAISKVTPTDEVIIDWYITNMCKTASVESWSFDT